MQAHKIFSDFAADEAALTLLKDGVAPHKILTPAKPAASVLGKSQADPALLEADIAFGQPDETAILHAPRLRWVHISSAGYARYDTPAFRSEAAKRGLILTNSSSVYAEPCAEHVFAFMLANARRLPVALQSRCANGTPEWLNLRETSTLLRNQRVVILGFGAIARHLVKMLQPFDTQIVALRREPKGDEGVAIITEKDLPQALAEADHVVNILPDNADSRHFISTQRLAMMKPGAVFYNIGRGATADQDALLAALRSKRLAAAWLDVTDPEPLPPDHPLLSEPNCFITPHTAGGHHNEAQSLVRHFLDNFQRFIKGAALRDRVM